MYHIFEIKGKILTPIPGLVHISLFRQKIWKDIFNKSETGIICGSCFSYFSILGNISLKKINEVLKSNSEEELYNKKDDYRAILQNVEVNIKNQQLELHAIEAIIYQQDTKNGWCPLFIIQKPLSLGDDQGVLKKDIDKEVRREKNIELVKSLNKPIEYKKEGFILTCNRLKEKENGWSTASAGVSTHIWNNFWELILSNLNLKNQFTKNKLLCDAECICCYRKINIGK